MGLPAPHVAIWRESVQSIFSPLGCKFGPLLPWSSRSPRKSFEIQACFAGPILPDNFTEATVRGDFQELQNERKYHVKSSKNLPSAPVLSILLSPYIRGNIECSNAPVGDKQSAVSNMSLCRPTHSMRAEHNLRSLSNHLVHQLSGVVYYINLTTEPPVPRESKASPHLAWLAPALRGQTCGC